MKELRKEKTHGFEECSYTAFKEIREIPTWQVDRLAGIEFPDEAGGDIIQYIVVWGNSGTYESPAHEYCEIFKTKKEAKEFYNAKVI